SASALVFPIFCSASLNRSIGKHWTLPYSRHCMSVPHLILVPGLMCDANVWQDQTRELGLSTTVTIPDHGSADSLGAMAEAIAAAAPARFAIAGHSMGGRVALEVFRRVPERLQGIALLDTAYAARAADAEGAEEAAKRYALLDIAKRNG